MLLVKMGTHLVEEVEALAQAEGEEVTAGAALRVVVDVSAGELWKAVIPVL